MGTLSELWRAAVSAPVVEPAFLAQEGGVWREVSWSEAGRSVDELAAGFLSLGIVRGDRVAILGRTRLEWTLCDWALITIGAPVVPVYPTSSPLECAYILGNSGARVLVCEDAAQLAKIEPARSELEALEHLITMESDGALSLDDLRRRGRALLDVDPAACDRARAAIDEQDLLTIVYTSGTTGPPKGCALSHRNYSAMATMIWQVEGLVEPGDRTVLHLPLAHTFGRLVEFLGPGGLTIAFCPDVLGVAAALREVRPTIFASIPRLYERVRAAIQAGFDEIGPAQRRVIGWALRVGSSASSYRREGRAPPRRLALEERIADRLVFSRIKKRLGGRLRVAISGGAPLAAEVAEFFHSVEVLLLEGYGLTECTAVASVNRPNRYRPGTVGSAVPGVELRIAPDGEILLRGENVFEGYYRDEQATSAVISEGGWLATGDLGELDSESFLTITGRKKDLIVTAGGENISPERIETAFTTSKFVSEAILVGDGRPFLVALLVPDREETSKAATTEDETRALLAHVVEEVNRRHGPAEQVKRFAILPRSLELERSELTPTAKVRRRVCEEHFREEIERLYRTQG